MGVFARRARNAKALLKRHVYDALDERGLIRGMRVEFTAPGRCELRTFEENGPGPGEVLVETIATVISTGTERAIYRLLETVSVDFPFTPGYCHAGRVAMTGPGCRYRVGELVATPGAHASLVLCPESEVFRVPAGVSLEEAAFTDLGVIAIQGVRRGQIEPGSRVVVLGSGLIGLLAAQVARLGGAFVVVCATSPARLKVAADCGLETLATAGNRTRLEGLAADIVIDATGNPEAVHDAGLAARDSATIVLLGSPRGVTRAFDVAAFQRRNLAIVGAHIANLPQADLSASAWPRRREGEFFLELAAQHRIMLSPLISRRAAPDQASAVYAEIARSEDRSVAVVFDWSRPGPWRTRIKKPSLLRGIGQAALRLTGRTPASPPPTSVARADGRVLRFGLIGCGEIAVESAAALEAAANCRIVFAADPNLEVARSLAAATGAPTSASVEELLESKDVDAVVISTPHHLHAPLAIQAARAGKHVVVEKPMATQVADCDLMIEAADRHGVSLSVCYCHRYDPRVQRAKELLQAGVVGRPIGTRIVFGQYRSREYWSSGLTGRSVSDWRGRRATSGGGVLIMNVCHILDYMAWLLDSELTDVVACTATLTQDVEVEDSISMSYRYAQGALGTLDATTSLVGPHVFEQVIRGTEGQLVVAPRLRFWSRRNVDGYESERWHEVTNLPQSVERRRFFEEFANSVLDRKAPPVSPREARAVQAAIEAAYLSAERKLSVKADSL